MKEIDALGLLCPRPVILAKKLIKEEDPTEFTVLVDNEIATENLSKMADQLGYDTKVEKVDKVYKVKFKTKLRAVVTFAQRDTFKASTPKSSPNSSLKL